jgi:hypothetical protein
MRVYQNCDTVMSGGYVYTYIDILQLRKLEQREFYKNIGKGIL